MEMSIDVSVVVPVHNVEGYLEECLESLVNQTLKQIEIICVDDHSTDSSRSILERYALRDSRIIILSSSELNPEKNTAANSNNKGAGYARNIGLSVAKGDYVIFLDADDYFELTFLEEMSRRIRDKGADICLCGAFNYNCETKKETKSPAVLKQGYLNGYDVFSAKEFPKNIFSITSPAPWSKLYKRSFLISNNLQFQCLDNSNDVFFYVATFVCAKSIVFIPKCFIHYRLSRPGSLQNSNKEKNPDNFCKALIKCMYYIVEKNMLFELQHAFSLFATEIIRFNLGSAKSYKEWKSVVDSARGVIILFDNIFIKENCCSLSSRWLELKAAFVNKSAEDILWESFLASSRENAELKRKLTYEKSKNKKLDNKIKQIRSSASFQIGSSILLPYRKIKQLLSKEG